jgi:hypothetical protein
MALSTFGPCSRVSKASRSAPIRFRRSGPVGRSSSTAGRAQDAPARDFVASLKGNVVRVVAGGETGFGFIVGLGAGKLLIATAEHTLAGGDASPRICFLDHPEPCPTGSVVYVDDPVPGQPDLDLALIEVAYPAGLVWRPDVMATDPTAGQPVWFIGRDQDWYIPDAPGRIVAREDTGTVRYAGLALAQGVSGAPIVTEAGIVAMHTDSEGEAGQAWGVALDEIRMRVVQRLRGTWALVPRGRCEAQGAYRGVLAGRWFTVHFDGSRPQAALDAMARLRCLGAGTLPRPAWSAAAWTGDGIVYGSGDLRTARTLQAVLAPLGRFDTHLGQPEGEAELWIR